MNSHDLATLTRWLAQESPTSDPQGVNGMADLVCDELKNADIASERIAGPAGIGEMLILRGGPNNGKPNGVVIGHLDTVHPRGTVDGPLPVRLEGDRLYGPGAYDMKTGILLGLRAIQRILVSGTADRPIIFALAPDEEIGSPFSRAVTESLLENAAFALVLEPARANGGCVTARKGVGRIEVEIEGVAAHAGINHGDGKSAILEAAHQIIAIEALTDYEAGLTTTVGKIAGGTAANTVPQHCSFSVDFRGPTAKACDHLLEELKALGPVNGATSIRISGGVSRPPFERTPGVVALLRKAQTIARGLGFELPEAPMTGGGSDGNFASARGIATLDGLGAEGAGAHTLKEYTIVSAFERRLSFLEKLVLNAAV